MLQPRITGFKGGRETALDQLRTCWKEGGIQAPFAALVLMGFTADVCTFLGELKDARGRLATWKSFVHGPKWL